MRNRQLTEQQIKELTPSEQQLLSVLLADDDRRRGVISTSSSPVLDARSVGNGVHVHVRGVDD